MMKLNLYTSFNKTYFFAIIFNLYRKSFHLFFANMTSEIKFKMDISDSGLFIVYVDDCDIDMIKISGKMILFSPVIIRRASPHAPKTTFYCLGLASNK